MGIRIVGGEWKSHPLESPPDSGVTRPTTNRVREAMASSVFAEFGLDLSGVSVLDAYAGSGALGLEFLSRGAAHLTSLDVDTGAVKRVESNRRALGVGRDRMMVVKADASAYASRPRCAGEPYGLVLLDPPYANDASVSEALVADLAAAGKLTEGCVVVYEHADRTPHFALEGFEERRHKVYGTISFDVLRRVGEHA